MTMLNKNDAMDFTKVGDPRYKKWKPIGKRLDMLEERAGCHVCQKKTDEYCSKCFQVPYCSEKHWKKDQQRHSKECDNMLGFKLSTSKDKNGGGPPFYTFSANKPQGSILMIEEPVAVFPVLPKEYGEEKDKPIGSLRMVCFGCNKHFSLQGAPVTCSSCGIWLCSKSCENVFHRKQECKILKKFPGRNFKQYLTSRKKYVELYLDICVLRILNYFAPAVNNSFSAHQWNTFLKMSSLLRYKNFSKSSKNYYDGIQYMKFMKKSVDVLKYSLEFASFNRDIVLQVYKTMIIFWETFELNSGVVSRVMFLDRHFMSQSYCAPNVASKIMFDEGRSLPTWYLYTTKEISIARDGPVKLMYDFSPHRFMALPLRIMYLNEIGLPCMNPSCSLCKDPSDGGSYSCSIRCFRCGEGLYVEGKVRGQDVLYDYPKRWSQEYIELIDWWCNACGDVQPFSHILDLNKKFDKYWRDIKKERKYTMIRSTMEFVDIYEHAYLHNCHGVILQAKYDFLIATREKHCQECGLDRFGQMATSEMISRRKITPKTKNGKLRLFPAKWTHDELNLTKRRAEYSNFCRIYLENTGQSYRAHEYPEYVFLLLESSTMSLLLSCHDFFMNLSRESAMVLKDAAKSTVEAFSIMDQKMIMIYRNFLKFDMLLTWPCEVKMISKAIQRDCHPLLMGLLILKIMKISLGDFMMGEGVHAKERHEQGADLWPFSFPQLSNLIITGKCTLEEIMDVDPQPDKSKNEA